MALKKKIVWILYDADTAIGINNEGSLVFSYNLEDTDHLQGGSDIYNGQNSVVWCNMRDAFGPQLKEMYKTLRSQGVISYSTVERMFEEHQAKWPEALKNEDEWFKYILPLIEDGNGSYLDMLQGFKSEQRKWWLYNRFRYIDSKYNAGDALADYITLRGYAKSNITITPYADIYPTVKYGSATVSQRGTRLTATTLVCPLDNVNDTEIMIYSASQLAKVGDLSGLKVGFADFSSGTRLQEIKIGDSGNSYENTNLSSLTLGNNKLLLKLDVRNCSGLGDTSLEGHSQTTVDISGCEIIEEIYFDGTKIQGLNLPNGGNIKKLHVPSTMTNLTILNQNAMTEFQIPSYTNITTLRIENSSVNTKAMINAIPANSRVRLIGFTWEAENATEIEGLLDTLDTMRGLDEAGNNMETAQVSGTIHTGALTGAQVASYNARYPYLNVTADHVTSYLTFKTYDGATTIQTVTCLDGTPQSNAPAVPSRSNSSDGHYSYTGIGWNTTQDSQIADASCITNVIADRTVYAAYTWVVQKYTVWFKNQGTTVETKNNVEWGTKVTYTGTTPTYNGQTSSGWDRDLNIPITGDTTINAVYLPVYTHTFVRASADGGGQLWQTSVVQGGTVTYGGSTPTTTQGTSEEFEFIGWSPVPSTSTANTTYTAVFRDKRSPVIAYLAGTLTAYESTTNTTKIAEECLSNFTTLTSAKAPVTTVEQNAFKSDTNLEVIDLSATSGAVTIAANAFASCSKLKHLIIRSSTKATLSNVSAFTSTPINTGDGAIYVPTALVSSYKADTNWKNFFIADIANYPLSVFDTVTDSQNTIIANTSSYGTDYAIGDTKSIDLGSTYGTVKFELVAKDEDNKVGGGKARMTWISKPIITTHAMNSTNTTVGGYDSSAMKAWINSDMLPLFPEAIRNAMVQVTKVSGTYENNAIVKNGQTTNEKLWIPSYYEVGFGNTYEDTGATYSTKFNSATARTKYYNGSAYGWWLRSAYSSGNFWYVNYYGYADYNNANNSNGVVLGFYAVSQSICMKSELYRRSK